MRERLFLLMVLALLPLTEPFLASPATRGSGAETARFQPAMSQLPPFLRPFLRLQSVPSNFQNSTESRLSNLESLISSQQIKLAKLKLENDHLRQTLSSMEDFIAFVSGIENPITNTTFVIDPQPPPSLITEYEYIADSDIFGTAPSSVIEAADSSGAAILSAMLAGCRRMIVDVRDAELTRNPDTLAQFIELSILPVAAGLEGLNAARNRVKLVFSTVSQLSEYRKLSTLKAPDVISLGTLNFGSVEEEDALVVILAPHPEDTEERAMFNNLLYPDNPKLQIEQPIVVINRHARKELQSEEWSKWEIVYHLRLLSIQYLSTVPAEEPVSNYPIARDPLEDDDDAEFNLVDDLPDGLSGEDPGEVVEVDVGLLSEEVGVLEEALLDDAAAESAREKEARSSSSSSTRAMVIRAYPRPWHVFVDTAADSDTDFEVAATFEDQPSQDEINKAIVECLEGSEIEDELVAEEMRQALESGQLEGVLGKFSAEGVEEEEEER